MDFVKILSRSDTSIRKNIFNITDFLTLFLS